MSKELLIVFIYDRELCKREEDDPQESIIYFYPAWVSNEQRHALCSQLMGVTQFASTLFSFPRVISLQSGKFSVKNLGRYSLVVGTDRNIPDVVLESRLKILHSLLRLFHKSIEELRDSQTDGEDSLSEKLAEIHQVYLPILQYATNTFGNIPLLKIPKSSSTLVLEATSLLEGYQEIRGVFGGTLLYQNKVVASQLNNELTRQLVVTDPYRIKLPAETVKGPFHLPLGVQLLRVYIPLREVERLKSDNEEMYSALDEVATWRKELDAQNKTSSMKGVEPSGGMKRDISRIFTVPEEEAIEERKEEDDIPDLVRDAMRSRHLARIQSVQPTNFVLPRAQAVAPSASARRTALTPDDLPSTKRVPIRYYSLGLPAVESEWTDSPVQGEKRRSLRRYYNTVCDPGYLLFKEDGLPASHCLSQSFLSRQIDSLKMDENKPGDKNTSSPNSPLIIKKKERPKMLETKEKLQSAKKSFTLPLNTFSGRRTEGGVPLTPLMAKLSQLAEEGSILETPLTASKDFNSNGCKTQVTPKKLPQKSEETVKDTLSCIDTSKEENVDLVPCALYVFGINNTSVLLLIDPMIAVQPEVVHSLWERSMLSLGEMDGRLRSALSRTEEGPRTAEYSYAVTEPSWGPVERGGPYQPQQLELLTVLHHSLTSRITDLLVRSEDTVTYGYQCGGRQVFYQESSAGAPGLPPPSDLMGLVPLKAKRVLERDHGILLL